MLSFKQKFNDFMENYLVFFILGFAILTLLPYTTALNSLSASNTGGLVYRGIILGFVLILFALILLCNNFKPNKPVTIFCLLYLISNVISIFATPAIREISDIPSIKSVVGVATVFSNIITIFMAIYLLKTHNIKEGKFEIAVYLLVGIGVALCLYSYIFQYKEISNMFSKPDGWNYDVTSIFQTKTTFGFCLLVISIFAVIHAFNTNKSWLLFFPVFFFANSVLIASKKSILCIGLLLIAVLIRQIIKTWKDSKKKWLISFGVIAGLVLIFTLLIGFKVGFFENINNFIRKVIFEDGVTVTKDRIEKITRIVNATNYPFGIIFGTGEGIGSYILSQSGAVINGDCIYTTIYSTGGLIKSSLYVFFIAYVIYLITKMDKSKEYKFFRIFFISILLICGLFEDDSLFGVNFSFLILCLPLYGNALKLD